MMNVFKLSIPALAGLLLGVLMIVVIGPQTTGGKLLLVFICMIFVIVVCAIGVGIKKLFDNRP